ncbi:hypothetical protein BGZ54_003032, partial [Gamsiella multidivaricata]
LAVQNSGMGLDANNSGGNGNGIAETVMAHERIEYSSAPEVSSSPVSGNLSGGDNSKTKNGSAPRLSLKAAIKKHLKVPPLFTHLHNHNHSSNNSNSDTGGKRHRRQWSLSALLIPSLLRTASSAA